MRPQPCARCGHVLFFENVSCVQCGARTGVVDGTAIVSLEPSGERWQAIGGSDGALDEDGRTFLPCANAEHEACNWMVDASAASRTADASAPTDGHARYCLACRHNLTIPDISDPGRLAAWRRMEVAKHRLMHALIRLGLPLVTREEDPDGGLGFEFLSADASGQDQVMTGHADGLITIDLAEADDAERERRRTAMGEPYRTLIGHFRHEVGHWYWNVLARDGGRLEGIRAVFGDDRADYSEALKRHYENGSPDGWEETHVSAYATAHPWEDFAETWAHYLHIVDTLDTVAAHRMGFGGVAGATGGVAGTLSAKTGPVRIDFDPYVEPDFTRIIEPWAPITIALNAVNRSMGLPDLYPFVLSPTITAKLGAIHDLVRGAPIRDLA